MRNKIIHYHILTTYVDGALVTQRRTAAMSLHGIAENIDHSQRRTSTFATRIELNINAVGRIGSSELEGHFRCLLVVWASDVTSEDKIRRHQPTLEEN